MSDQPPSGDRRDTETNREFPDDDYDSVAAALYDDVRHNVGFPMTRNSYHVVKLLRRGPSRPNCGSDIKFHRVITEGTWGRAERNEVKLDAPLDYLDRYQKVMYRAGHLGAFRSSPFHVDIWPAYGAMCECGYVLDPPHGGWSTGDRNADDAT